METEPREDKLLPTHNLGYAINKENYPMLAGNGMPVEKMFRMIEANGPPDPNTQANPMDLVDPLNQGNQGACQGHSLATCFTLCYFLATGRIEAFSRAAGYYLSQRVDGIRGDRGSTLSAGMQIATKHGMCLEKDWPYPRSYDPTEPRGLTYPFKLVASQPTSDYSQIEHAIKVLGLPVQDGIIWDNSVSRSISTDYVGSGGGGHSTTLFGMIGQNFRRINSWGMWDGDGCNENTPRSLKKQVEHRYSSHIIYAPAGMIYPELSPVG